MGPLSAARWARRIVEAGGLGVGAARPCVGADRRRPAVGGLLELGAAALIVAACGFDDDRRRQRERNEAKPNPGRKEVPES